SQSSDQRVALFGEAFLGQPIEVVRVHRFQIPAAARSLTPRTAQSRLDLLDRGALGFAYLGSVLAVGARDLVRERQHESTKFLNLVWARLALEQLHSVPQMLEAVILELLRRVVARAIDLGSCGDDLVEQLAGAVLLARVHVRLADRERLTERSPVLCRRDDHAGSRRSLQHNLPFLL